MFYLSQHPFLPIMKKAKEMTFSNESRNLLPLTYAFLIFLWGL
jgi:hypothetical protein